MIACSAAATGLTASTLKLYADKHEAAFDIGEAEPGLRMADFPGGNR